jgi:hypothetical protein
MGAAESGARRKKTTDLLAEVAAVAVDAVVRRDARA